MILPSGGPLAMSGDILTFLIDLFLAALGLRGCAQAFSSCRGQGSSLAAVLSLLMAAASLVKECGLSCPAACEIFPGQGSDPCTGRRICDPRTTREILGAFQMDITGRRALLASHG